MKKIVIAAIAGLMVLACSAFYSGSKKRPAGPCSPDFMRSQGKTEPCGKTDEIDQLLMLVLSTERNTKPQAPMTGRGGPQQGQAQRPMTGRGGPQQRPQCPVMGRGGPQQGPQAQCTMMGKGGPRNMGKGQKMHHGRQGGNEAGMLKAYLQEKYPEELKEIAALKKSNDETAKKVIDRFKQLVGKARTELKEQREKAVAEHKKMIEMIEEYKKSKDTKLAEQIKAKLGEVYDKRLEIMKKRIDSDSERVQKAREKLEELNKNKDQEITKQLELISK